MEKIKTFDLDRWSEPDEQHHVRHIGGRGCLFPDVTDRRRMLPYAEWPWAHL